MLHPLRDFCRHDVVSLLDVPQEVRALHNVPEAGVAAIEDVLARRGQVGVEEEPEELRRTGVCLVLRIEEGEERSNESEVLVREALASVFPFLTSSLAHPIAP